MPPEAWGPLSVVLLAIVAVIDRVWTGWREAAAKKLEKEETALLKAEAKAEAEEIKETLRKTAKDVKKAVRLADGTMAQQKLLVAQMARSKAVAGGNQPADVLDAEKAESIYEEHKASLAAADAAAEATNV